MFTFFAALSFLAADPLPTSSVGFGEFILRAGLGMVFLAIFVGICCVAWHTLPFLKGLIPGFFVQVEEKQAPVKRPQVLMPLKTVKSSPATSRPSEPTNVPAQAPSSEAGMKAS